MGRILMLLIDRLNAGFFYWKEGYMSSILCRCLIGDGRMPCIAYQGWTGQCSTSFSVSVMSTLIWLTRVTCSLLTCHMVARSTNGADTISLVMTSRVGDNWHLDVVVWWHGVTCVCYASDDIWEDWEMKWWRLMRKKQERYVGLYIHVVLPTNSGSAET